MNGAASLPTSATRNNYNSGLNMPNGYHQKNQSLGTRSSSSNSCCAFQMPLHYPRFKKTDYEKMPEPQLDCLLKAYGLPAAGDLNQKRKFAMGAFLWPDQY
ncbi:unnamed protein product [Coffea canephora]|uniref:DUF7722 domain-containing protein n=1 Tax=Coffea canephora TaxID=49390 RepID=A0A068UUZ8_COFCA|nr:unnamed protein product [Coffea canephora]